MIKVKSFLKYTSHQIIKLLYRDKIYLVILKKTIEIELLEECIFFMLIIIQKIFLTW